MPTEIRLMTRRQFASDTNYCKYYKRVIDLVLALGAIVVLAPVFLGVALLVRIKLGSPVLFRQKRPGFREKIFVMYKFRTMTDKRDVTGRLLPDPLRLTKFGRMLRSTSLDELPELFNIVKGEMSIVGPRPQLVKDLGFMSPEQRFRQAVMPGLTGWAQVNGRNAVAWETKLAFDLEYIDNISFRSDLKIILMTLAKVIKREGISSNGMETAEDLGDYLLRTAQITSRDYDAALEKSKESAEV
jgi:undecaprenyl phosphate N,N'-diacetylbacillosamine 1-phosphate transferase